LRKVTEDLQDKIREYDTTILSSDDSKRRGIVREAVLEDLKTRGQVIGSRIEQIHSETEISTDEFEPEEQALVERLAQRILLGVMDDDPPEIEEHPCRENAIRLGANRSHEYLPIKGWPEGHPTTIPKFRRPGGSEMEESVDDGSEEGSADSVETDGGTESRGSGDVGGGSVPNRTQQPTPSDATADNASVIGLPESSRRFQAYDAAVSEEGQHDPLTEYQIYKLLYYIERTFIGYKKVDAIKNDTRVEDIVAPSYEAPVYVTHKAHGNVRTNINQTREEMDSFVTSLVQLAGEELSRQQPMSSAKLPDGSRAEFEIGHEVSDKGTSYAIRQFTQLPHTPVDLIDWGTYSLTQMSLLWLYVENGMSVLISGPTGSGKTTTTNALSLFIPSSDRIVSIEETQELDLPQENWTANVTREAGDLTSQDVEIDEFELLERALRKNPDRIILGEVRGEEARTMLEAIRTGHSGMTTFHAPTIKSVFDRMTTEPQNAPLQTLTEIDLIAIQNKRTVGESEMRRNDRIVEIDGFKDTEDTEKITRTTITEWDAQTDTQQVYSDESTLLDRVQDQNGWSDYEQKREIQVRRLVLAGLIANEINEYHSVSGVLQASMLDTDAVLGSIANRRLNKDVDTFTTDIASISLGEIEREREVDRPAPSSELKREAEGILKESRTEGILSEYV
jgi:type IV secretory pathway ATPase VirB11/archaellum biosynthesis ATPase